MFKTKIGVSTNQDAFSCSKEATEKIAALDNLKLGMLFTNLNNDNKKAIEGVKSVLGSKAIIGANIPGIITQEGLIDDGPFASIYGIGGSDVIVGLAYSEESDNPREIGKKIARAAITNAGIKKVPAYFFMLSNTLNEEEYLKGIEDVIGTVPFFGGNVSGDIICNENIIKKGIAVAFFYSRVEFKNIYSGEYNETRDAGVITKINGDRILIDIDRMPAVKKYAEWLGQDSNEFMGKEIYTKSILSPLGVKDPLGSVTRVMHPLMCNNDYSLTLSNNLALGTAVMRLETTPNDIINANKKLLESLNSKMKKNPVGYFLIESFDRINILENKKNEVFDIIKKTIPNNEFMMILTNGEFGACDHSANTCGALSMSFTSFGE